MDFCLQRSRIQRDKRIERRIGTAKRDTTTIPSETYHRDEHILNDIELRERERERDKTYPVEHEILSSESPIQ